MVFYGLEKFSLIEWPGKICAVLFVGGCNFRCPWCYNRDLVLNYKNLPAISEKEVLKFLKSRKKYLDGVMISGGETLQNQKPEHKTKSFVLGRAHTYGLWSNIKNQKYKLKNKKYLDDLTRFIKKVRKIGLKVGIETNGSNPVMLKKLIDEKLIDFVAMDVKAPISSKFSIRQLAEQENFVTKLSVRRSLKSEGEQPQSKYKELTGVKKVDLEKIKKSIEIIKNSGLDYEFRTTYCPLLSEEDILEIAQELKGAKRFALQVFRPTETLINPKLAKIKALSKEDLEKIGQKIKENFGKFEIRG